MKIRNDFITNSSSTSYVISFDSKGFDLENPFVKICWKFMIGDGTFIKSKEDLDNHFIDYYGYRGCETLELIIDNEPYLEEFYNEIKNELENGRFVLKREVDYNDETTYSIIDELAREKYIKILQRD